MDDVNQANELRLLTLVRGIMQQGGGFYWCYVAIKPNLVSKFQKAIEAKYNIQNFVKDAYGEVVVSGRGRTPPPEITKKVSEMFGITPQDLEEGNAEVGIAKILASLPQSDQ
jgi:hypothetical protein